MDDTIDIPILCADIEAYTERPEKAQVAAMRHLQDESRKAAHFFAPYTRDPWKHWPRQGTGDGYYFQFNGLGPAVALKFADAPAEAISAPPSNQFDSPPKVTSTATSADITITANNNGDNTRSKPG